MTVNRNQLLFVAVLLMLLGVQLRNVTAYVLTTEATRVIARHAVSDPVAVAAIEKLPPFTLRPPQWLGSLLLAVGVVVFFQAMAMAQPG
jgi:hypothetical protein